MRRDFISVEGTFNFRDVGGRPTTDGGRTREGVQYRSASLDRLTSAGLRTIAELDVEVVVDVRSRDEVERHGRVDAQPAQGQVAQGIERGHVVESQQQWQLVRDHRRPRTDRYG